MYDDEDVGLTTLLQRTPAGLPAFVPDLGTVNRRGRRLRRRRRVGIAALGTVLAAAIAVPLALLAGVLRLSTGQPAQGPAQYPMKLIQYYVPSTSMEPTFRVGDVLLVDTNAYRFGRAPQLGDVVLFRWDHLGQHFQLLKRVIGLPGQTVEIRRGVVFIDGHRLDEGYLGATPDLSEFGPLRVVHGHLFVLGDDRANSNDSRFAVGQVSLTDVNGKVVGIAAPGSRVVPPTAGTARLGKPSLEP